MKNKLAFVAAMLAALSCGAASGPSPDRPLMIQRFSQGQERPEIWERTLAGLKANRACADEVWFSNGTCFPRMARHAEQARRMAKCAADLRAIGIVPSLQIQATIGHGDNPKFTAEDMAGRTWGGYVGKNGEVCKQGNCPRQEGFLAYLREMSELYAAWHPGSVWIDDDLRMNNHAPAMSDGGCHCETCVGLFSKREGRQYTRESLVAACAADPELAKRWFDFGAEGMAGVAEAIAEGFHRISPETRIGLQHNNIPERDAIFRKLQEKTGMRPASRPGGYDYSDHNPYVFINKSLAISRQIVGQPGYETLDQVCAEIENYPRIFTCKTAQGMRLESLLFLAIGVDSLSYYATNPTTESPEWTAMNMYAPLAEDLPFYREYVEWAAGTHPAGMSAGRGYDHWKDVELQCVGLPTAGYDRRGLVRVVTADVVSALSDAELEKELSECSVLLNGAAVTALGKRGLSRLIGGATAESVTGHPEFYTDDRLNAGLPVDRHAFYNAPAFAFTVPASANARILGEYRFGDSSRPATVLMKRENGTYAALLGAGGFSLICTSSSRVLFLYRLLDEMAGGRLPALPAEPVQCNIIPRVDDSGNLRCVTVTNTTIGTQRPFDLRLRGVPETATKVEYVAPSTGRKTLELRRNGAECMVMVPEIGAWDICYLKIM